MKNRWKITIGVVVGLAAAVLLTTQVFMRYPEAGENRKAGKWYRISDERAKASDGSEVHAYFKQGSVNKLIIYFQGGGVSINEETAGGEGYYSKNQPEPDAFMNTVSNIGIGNKKEANPFHDWSMLVIPYATGDFHIGQSEFSYGDGKTFYHNGYNNYTAFMERAVQLVGSPDDLLICGFSAGGFGTSLLASDIIENYYDVVNTTVLVDSSLLLYDDWQDAAKTIWNAPEQITARLTGDNLVLDSLIALSEVHPEVKILFDCSIRDGELARFQHYLNGGDNTVSAADGDVFEANLKEMVKGIQDSLPNSAIYIWDGLKYQGKDEHLTLHTIILIPHVYKETFGNDKTIAEWIMDAVNGTMENYGLDLMLEE